MALAEGMRQCNGVFGDSVASIGASFEVSDGEDMLQQVEYRAATRGGLIPSVSALQAAATRSISSACR